ncbi:hypothetical protein QBC46DRAFT_429695 [Diplogelasinospora grovesii]|uniref:Uncharacterized protein n=1 Tax=Diplogelasinospora grovesii TaxID=303347 RepID=A0AAN6MVU5_9PEZI|nr:hypothetical protein QBC46DRAFT_429695 [Diplogelasinospora grovesii]
MNQFRRRVTLLLPDIELVELRLRELELIEELLYHHDTWLRLFELEQRLEQDADVWPLLERCQANVQLLHRYRELGGYELGGYELGDNDPTQPELFYSNTVDTLGCCISANGGGQLKRKSESLSCSKLTQYYGGGGDQNATSKNKRTRSNSSIREEEDDTSDSTDGSETSSFRHPERFREKANDRFAIIEVAGLPVNPRLLAGPGARNRRSRVSADSLRGLSDGSARPAETGPKGIELEKEKVVYPVTEAAAAADAQSASIKLLEDRLTAIENGWTTGSENSSRKLRSSTINELLT